MIKRIFHNRRRLVLTFLLAVLSSSIAEVYQWQDDRGRTHYTGRVHENSKKLPIKPGYSYYTVDKVFDGDTIRLSDGRRIRLLGINTPEVSHRGRDSEAGGEIAKRWLKEKLADKKVRLQTDTELTDKYRRTLAHVFTETGEHINLQLVETGLASVNIYPPNLSFVKELADAQNRAEQDRRGIWANPAYAAMPADRLDIDGNRKRWMRIQGRVRTIRSSRKFVYLELNDMLQARIEKKWLPLFPDVETYRGKTVELRGWLNKNRDGWSMLIRHPSAIKIC